MSQVEIILPKMGESVAEATIIKWLVEEGAEIDMDDPVIEIATDKVDSEIPAPEAGFLIKKLVNEGDVVKVGEPIGIISASANTSATVEAEKTEPAEVEVTTVKEKLPATEVAIQQNDPSNEYIPKSGPSGKFYSPLVRNIAQQENISLVELEQIEGTGLNNRVTKKDILAYIPNKGTTSQEIVKPQTKVETVKEAPKVALQKEEASKAVSFSGEHEVIEMDRMRKLIADHMVMSKKVSPHVTSFVEADVTNMVAWREKNKKEFQAKEGEKITYTPLILEAVIKAIKDFPMINSSLEGNNIILKKDINIGVATALPSGNLIVPVIKKADRYNLIGLTKSINELVDKARNNKLSPDDIQGGTYTVSNVGTFGNVMGTPIINQPQVGILAVGTIKKKPAVIETPSGDTIGIRHFMFLSHSYDHRTIDGALGGSFVRRVADYLEAFDLERKIS